MQKATPASVGEYTIWSISSARTSCKFSNLFSLLCSMNGLDVFVPVLMGCCHPCWHPEIRKIVNIIDSHRMIALDYCLLKFLMLLGHITDLKFLVNAKVLYDQDGHELIIDWSRICTTSCHLGRAYRCLLFRSVWNVVHDTVSLPYLRLVSSDWRSSINKAMISLSALGQSWVYRFWWHTLFCLVCSQFPTQVKVRQLFKSN